MVLVVDGALSDRHFGKKEMKRKLSLLWPIWDFLISFCASQYAIQASNNLLVIYVAAALQSG